MDFFGIGEFGDVYKGELTTTDKKKIPIAVKTLKVFDRISLLVVLCIINVFVLCSSKLNVQQNNCQFVMNTFSCSMTPMLRVKKTSC